MTERARATAPSVPIFSLDQVPEAFRGGVVAIGNFDGLHRGHHALIHATRREADERGAPALMLTFEPHPRTLFRPDHPVFRLTSAEAKARLLAAFAFDALIVARFDRAFAGIEAEDFVRSFLVDRLAIAGAVVGFDFQFGHDRRGTPAFLAAEAARHGFSVSVMGAVTDPAGEVYSSTRIRRALEAGDIPLANALLDYRWFVAGTVGHGDKRGRLLGYPTANIRLEPDCRLRHGIYAVRLTRADGRVHDGVASYGRRPTFDNGATLLEVHVFDFSGDLYGETVTVSFHGFLRGEERFESAEALIAQMDRDSAQARTILAAAGDGTPLDRRLAGKP